MRFGKASTLILAWGLVMFTANGVMGQDLFGAEASAEADADGEASGGSPIDEMESKPENEPAEAEEGGGGARIGGPLLLTQHTMQLGGDIAIIPRVTVTDAGSDGGGIFTFSPYMGYFVIDNLEVMLALGIWVPFGGAQGPWGGALENYPFRFSILGGARYVFDFRVVCLYVGGLIGTSFDVPDNPNAPVANWFNISVPVGLLIPFNPHVALKVGASFDFYVHLGDDNNATVFEFPVGYFGVEGFFNLFGK